MDASYANHADCKGHKGAMMTMGEETVIRFSQELKINAKSFMEAELIGIDDALTQVLWTQYFLQFHGYRINSNIIYQDNKSTIVLKHKEKVTRSKQTMHI